MFPLRTVSFSLLTPHTMNRLQQAGITTVTGFLNRDINEISSETQVPYRDLIGIRQALIQQFSPCMVKASDLYYELLKNASVFSTGCAKLDSLCEGIFTGEITQFVGSSCSGKTQLCFSVATSVCLETQRSVLHVDTNGSFSAQRMFELACAKATDEQSLQGMKRIQLVLINDVQDLISYLTQPQNLMPDLGLIIVDSIYALLSPNLDNKFFEGRGYMVQVAQLLSRLASRRHLAVIVCNSLVNGENYSLKPALGRYWQHIPSVSIRIEPENANLSVTGGQTLGEKRRVTLLKNPRLRTGRSVIVQLSERGFL